MTDSAFRDQVRRQAVACGWPAATAAHLASMVGRDIPKDAERVRDDRTTMRFMAVQGRARPAPKTREQRIEAIVSLYGGPASLASDLIASNATSRAVAAWLDQATGTAPRISLAGAERVRLEAFAHDRKGAPQ